MGYTHSLQSPMRKTTPKGARTSWPPRKNDQFEISGGVAKANLAHPESDSHLVAGSPLLRHPDALFRRGTCPQRTLIHVHKLYPSIPSLVTCVASKGGRCRKAGCMRF